MRHACWDGKQADSQSAQVQFQVARIGANATQHRCLDALSHVESLQERQEHSRQMTVCEGKLSDLTFQQRQIDGTIEKLEAEANATKKK